MCLSLLAALGLLSTSPSIANLKYTCSEVPELYSIEESNEKIVRIAYLVLEATDDLPSMHLVVLGRVR